MKPPPKSQYSHPHYDSPPHLLMTLKCCSQQTFAFITKPLLTLVTFISFKTRVGRSIDTPGSGYYSWEFLQKPIWVTTNFCSPLFLFSSMLDVMWRFCGSFSACFYCFSKIGSRTEHGSYKKLHCEHKRTTSWGESFSVEVVTGSSVPNPWNKKFRFRHWCNNMIYTLMLYSGVLVMLYIQCECAQ